MTIEINGTERGFLFGTYTMKLIREETGILTVEELWGNLFPKVQKDEDGNVVRQIIDIDYLSFLTKFYYCCAKHYALSNKQKVEFSEIDVSDWLDEIGKDKALEIFNILIKTYTEKNLKAPAMGLTLEQQ